MYDLLKRGDNKIALIELIALRTEQMLDIGYWILDIYPGISGREGDAC